jgi:imidazole glycerol-phosphate synthase subunit HisF
LDAISRNTVLKKRIIPKFLVRNGRLVKGVRFHDNFREAGNPVSTARVYESYGVDELMFLDIDAAVTGQRTMVEIMEAASRDIFMPFTGGGGVTTLDDINRLLQAGADKVSVNTAAVEDPAFVKRGATAFGDQCIIVAIDYAHQPDGRHRVYTHGGRHATELDPVEWALRAQDLSCGEILLCSIDRDGTLEGYDLEMIAQLSERLEVPIIASSGAGSLQHCIDAFAAGASAIAISSLFLFTDHSPIKVRSFLHSKGVNVRASASSRN